MKLSVIIPVYNVEKYLSDCLNSFITQLRCSDIEILLIDDGSIDGSGKICDVYANKYDIIEVFHKDNGGLSSARNFGLNYSTGDYIMFIDSDDAISYYLFENVLRLIEKENPDLIEYNFDSFFDGTDYNDDNICYIDDYMIIEGTNDIFDLYFAEKIKRETWTKIYRKDLFENILFPVGRLAEDLATTYKLLNKCNKVIMINKNLYHYRIRGNSIMSNSSVKLYYDAMLAHYEIYDFVKNNDSYVEVSYTNYFNNLMKLYAKNDIEKLNYNTNEIIDKYNHIKIQYLNFTSKIVFILSKINLKITLTFLYLKFIKGGRKI